MPLGTVKSSLDPLAVTLLLSGWRSLFLPFVLTWSLISFHNSLKMSPWDSLGQPNQVVFIIYKPLQSFESKEGA